MVLATIGIRSRRVQPKFDQRIIVNGIKGYRGGTVGILGLVHTSETHIREMIVYLDKAVRAIFNAVL